MDESAPPPPPIVPIVRIQAEPFEAAAEAAALVRGRTDVGAVVTFTGLCRDEGGRLAALELEHYPGMAQAEIARVAGEAARRFPLQGLVAIHRYGVIRPGDEIVLVVAASPHRRAAFEAADFMMDWLKTKAPFWKREHPAGEAEAGGWVASKAEDERAADRWVR
ncbi:molybdenum cofactor biosynthesis protein MoaE [Salinarimonas chemoclinalis]|uniref:molybdenum cofactor biosynthesis protein MoaE n=1 Tax=Salinarimonas chemoclinalis TaxID=3241599 RepID=UPI0035565391